VSAASIPTLPQGNKIVFALNADTVAAADGTAISSWVDSINSVAATQATGTLQPKFYGNLFGGKGGVRFDGVDDVLQLGRPTALTTAADSQIYSILVVCRVLSAKFAGAMFGASAGGNSLFVMGDGASLGRFDGSLTGSAGPTTGNGFFSVLITSTKPFTAGSGTGLERIYINGGCIISNVTEAPGSGGNNFSVGNLTGGALPSNCEIFQIRVWNTALTPTEAFQAHGWACYTYSQPTPWSTASSIDVYDGDSISAGVGAGGVAGTYPYKSAQTRSKSYGQWTNVGVGGIQLHNNTNKIGEWSGIQSYTGKPLRVAAFEYYNERSTAQATMQGYISAYCSAVRSIANTKLCFGTSTSHSGDPDANRIAAYNYVATNNATLCDAYVPLHTNTSIGTTGAYAANSATYWSDTVHLNAAGYTILASLMSAGLNTIP
jgi:hypothetical protein